MAVRCVEQWRETGSRTFQPAGELAELGLRQMVLHRQQAEVWQKVEQINAALGLAPPTRTYRLAAARMKDVALIQRRDHLETELRAYPERGKMVGLVAVVDNEVVAIDRFATPELYSQMEDELLASYVVSADGAAAAPARATHSSTDVDARRPDSGWSPRRGSTHCALRRY